MKLTENKESRNPAYIDNPIEQKLTKEQEEEILSELEWEKRMRYLEAREEWQKGRKDEE